MHNDNYRERERIEGYLKSVCSASNAHTWQGSAQPKQQVEVNPFLLLLQKEPKYLNHHWRMKIVGYT